MPEKFHAPGDGQIVVFQDDVLRIEPQDFEASPSQELFNQDSPIHSCAVGPTRQFMFGNAALTMQFSASAIPPIGSICSQVVRRLMLGELRRTMLKFHREYLRGVECGREPLLLGIALIYVTVH